MAPSHSPLPVQFFDPTNGFARPLGLSGAGHVWAEPGGIALDGMVYNGRSIELKATGIRLLMVVLIMGGLVFLTFVMSSTVTYIAFLVTLVVVNPLLWIYSLKLRMQASAMYAHETMRIPWAFVERVTPIGGTVSLKTTLGTTEVVGWGPQGVAAVHAFAGAIAAQFGVRAA